METNPLGKSKLTVTRLGLGLAALGRPGYINLNHAKDLNEEYSVEAMEKHAHAVMDAAWKAGIRYYDAARSYGKAEQFLGHWLKARSISEDEVTIGSKWGYTYTADWQIEADKHEVKDHSIDVLTRQRKESEETLGDYLDLYQIHSATLDSGVLTNDAVLNKLGEYRDAGLAIGLSLSGAKQSETLKRAIEVEINGKPLFTAVQATWNLLEPSAGEALQEAADAGMGVIVKEAVANGRLTSKNSNPQDREMLGILAETAAAKRTTIDALALAAVLAQPWVSVVLSGAATIEQLEANVKALQINYDKKTAERLKSVAQNPADYWDFRSGLAWN